VTAKLSKPTSLFDPGVRELGDLWTNPVTGRCEKNHFRICSELGVNKIALGCRINDRWGVGKHLGSKIKSRKLEQIIFLTSSRRVVIRAKK
jgi:hypothetical protein